jgi:hypothetical protein
LGAVAAKVLTDNDMFDAALPHPQYVKRFKARDVRKYTETLRWIRGKAR